MMKAIAALVFCLTIILPVIALGNWAVVYNQDDVPHVLYEDHHHNIKIYRKPDDSIWLRLMLMDQT
jgi:hypothetical protein